MPTNREAQGEVERIVAGLTDAQRRAMQVGFKPTTQWATYMALKNKGLLILRACFPDGEGMPLTPLGLAVRQALQTQEPDHG